MQISAFLAIIETLLAVSATLFLGYLLLKSVKAHAENLKIMQVALDKAYENATALIQDPSTPDSVINFIDKYYAYVGRPIFTRVLTAFLFFRLIFNIKSSESKTEDAFSKDVKTLSKAQKEHLTLLVNYGAISCIMADLLFSGVYMSLWQILTSSTLMGSGKDKPSPERIDSIAVVMNKVYMRREEHEHRHAVAA